MPIILLRCQPEQKLTKVIRCFSANLIRCLNKVINNRKIWFLIKWNVYKSVCFNNTQNISILLTNWNIVTYYFFLFNANYFWVTFMKVSPFSDGCRSLNILFGLVSSIRQTCPYNCNRFDWNASTIDVSTFILCLISVFSILSNNLTLQHLLPYLISIVIIILFPVFELFLRPCPISSNGGYYCLLT